MMEAIVTKVVRDEGTVVLFAATTVDTQVEITFACDHRYAQDLVDALAAGEEPLVVLESWQIMSLR